MNKENSAIMEKLQEIIRVRELTEENRRLHKKLEEKESKINELQPPALIILFYYIIAE